jgi:hypothetical protein
MVWTPQQKAFGALVYAQTGSPADTVNSTLAFDLEDAAKSQTNTISNVGWTNCWNEGQVFVRSIIIPSKFLNKFSQILGYRRVDNNETLEVILEAIRADPSASVRELARTFRTNAEAAQQQQELEIALGFEAEAIQTITPSKSAIHRILQVSVIGFSLLVFDFSLQVSIHTKCDSCKS